MGRTWQDAARKAIFFNWSGSGFEVHFFGTKLVAEIEAFPDERPLEGKCLPYVQMIIDGDVSKESRIELKEGVHCYTLQKTAKAEEHHIAMIKLSENARGRNCLVGLYADGELLPPGDDRRPYIEFVGDSITCGFGNEQKNEDPFLTARENVLETYAAYAARQLDCQMQMICLSGIPLCWSPDSSRHIRMPMEPYLEIDRRTMEICYPYTDWVQQQSDGGTQPEIWNFAQRVPVAVVINLGTNDAFRLSVTEDHGVEERHFYERYLAFLKMVRRFNGPTPVISCTLGPMNYYLYDVIIQAVEAYRKETGDARIFCLKFGAIDIWKEGYGGGAHPNVSTHRRMGRELADALKLWLKDGRRKEDAK